MLEILSLHFIFWGYPEASWWFWRRVRRCREARLCPPLASHPKWERGHWFLVLHVARVDVSGAGEAGRLITGAFGDRRQGGWWRKPLGMAVRCWGPASFMQRAGRPWMPACVGCCGRDDMEDDMDSRGVESLLLESGWTNANHVSLA